MTADPYITAILDSHWHRSSLVRVAKSMRARPDWTDAARFERGEGVTVASGEIEMKGRK